MNSASLHSKKSAHRMKGGVNGDWREVTLGEIFDISSSKRVLQEQWEKAGVPFYRAREIVKLAEDGTVQNELFISERLYTEFKSKYGVPKPGDLMVSAVGTLGACYVVQPGDRFYFKDASVLRFSPKQQVCSRFIQHAFRTDAILDQVHAGSGSTVGTYTIARASETRLWIPPPAEQQRLADILDKADALRAKRRAALAQLDTLTQSIFLDMFGDPIENPRRLSVRKMIDLVDSARPISYGILMPGPDQIVGVKYVRVVDMQDGGIELPGIRRTTEAISNSFRRSLLKTGDLLMSIRGHVGRLAVVPPALDGANITQDTARLAIAGADPVFVRECLRTQGFQRWMAKHTKGVAVRGINLGDVKLMPVITPNLSEQRKFARLATATDEVKAATRAALSELDALFAALQHRAFRGEL